MKIKAKFKSLLAALLVLATLCTALASCADSINGDESNSDSLGSDISTDANGNIIEDGGAESESGSIPIFANGEYVAKIIRSEFATTFEKDVYNKIKELFKKKRTAAGAWQHRPGGPRRKVQDLRRQEIRDRRRRPPDVYHRRRAEEDRREGHRIH